MVRGEKRIRCEREELSSFFEREIEMESCEDARRKKRRNQNRIA